VAEPVDVAAQLAGALTVRIQTLTIDPVYGCGRADLSQKPLARFPSEMYTSLCRGNQRVLVPGL